MPCLTPRKQQDNRITIINICVYYKALLGRMLLTNSFYMTIGALVKMVRINQ